MDKNAEKACKKKSKMQKKFNLSQNKFDELKYKETRNKATTAYRTAKVNYEKSLACNIKTNSKTLYAYVRSKSKVKDSIACIKNKDGVLLTEEKSICEEINGYLSVFTRENSEPPIFKSKFRGGQEDLLVEILFDEQIVFETLSHLAASEASAPDYNLFPKV